MNGLKIESCVAWTENWPHRRKRTRRIHQSCCVYRNFACVFLFRLLHTFYVVLLLLACTIMCKVCRRRYTQHRARAYTRRELESDSSYIRLYNTFVHCTHIDVCAREIEYAHTNENSGVRSPVRSFGLFVCRSLALARTRSCINTHTIHRTLLYHNFINIIIAQFACIPCPCATQKSTECSIGISSIKYIHNNFSIFRCVAVSLPNFFLIRTYLFIFFICRVFGAVVVIVESDQHSWTTYFFNVR